MLTVLLSCLLSTSALASAQAKLLVGHNIYAETYKSSHIRGYAIAGSVLEVQKILQGGDCTRGWAVVKGGYL